jgi:hypothetical protein
MEIDLSGHDFLPLEYWIAGAIAFQALPGAFLDLPGGLPELSDSAPDSDGRFQGNPYGWRETETKQNRPYRKATKGRAKRHKY